MKLSTIQGIFLFLAGVSFLVEMGFWAFGTFRGTGMAIGTAAWFCFILAFWLTKLVKQ
jgi:hypothetical protein